MIHKNNLIIREIPKSSLASKEYVVRNNVQIVLGIYFRASRKNRWMF